MLLDKKDRLGTDPMNLLNELYNQCQTGRIELHRLDKRSLGRFTDLVNRIKKRDPYIEAMDVLIVAYSMIDKKCRSLLTFEGKLINSRSLKDLIFEHIQDRKGYTITDRPRI